MAPIDFDSHGTSIRGELYSPETSAGGPVVVLAYGSDALMEPWGTGIREYALGLAGHGFTVLIPNYFDKTGTPPGLHALSQFSNTDAWAEAVRDACVYTSTLAGVSGGAPGLLGFSLGGNVCLRLRGYASALVELFAPLLGGIGARSGSEKPDVQIHHGLADTVVPFRDSHEIASTLRGEGIAVQTFSYEGAGHGFGTTGEANAIASRVARERTLAFFKRTLIRS
jgi:carboxymethylenebutenolidase